MQLPGSETVETEACRDTGTTWTENPSEKRKRKRKKKNQVILLFQLFLEAALSFAVFTVTNRYSLKLPCSCQAETQVPLTNLISQQKRERWKILHSFEQQRGKKEKRKKKRNKTAFFLELKNTAVATGVLTYADDD